MSAEDTAENVPPEKRYNTVTKEERNRLIEALKSFSMTPVSLRGFAEAIITSGVAYGLLCRVMRFFPQGNPWKKQSADCIRF